MSVTNLLRATLAVAALAPSLAAMASDASYDRMQLREIATTPARGPQLVAAVDPACCRCRQGGDVVEPDAASAHEHAAPARAATPGHPTTGIDRR